jgi:hypothetical protein
VTVFTCHRITSKAFPKFDYEKGGSEGMHVTTVHSYLTSAFTL